MKVYLRGVLARTRYGGRIYQIKDVRQYERTVQYLIEHVVDHKAHWIGHEQFVKSFIPLGMGLIEPLEESTQDDAESLL